MSNWLGVTVIYRCTEDMYVRPAGGRAYEQFSERLLIMKHAGVAMDKEDTSGVAHPQRVMNWSIKNGDPDEILHLFKSLPWNDPVTLIMTQEANEDMILATAGSPRPFMREWQP